MVHHLSEKHSLLSNWIAEIRDVSVQKDRMRFRRNIERIGEVIAYEMSKGLPSKLNATTTPLGIHDSKVLAEQPVIATVLRAGLPLHQGMLNYFDKADNAFKLPRFKQSYFDCSGSYVSYWSFLSGNDSGNH
jgi:uracil phosphoribosyltransferase